MKVGGEKGREEGKGKKDGWEEGRRERMWKWR